MNIRLLLGFRDLSIDSADFMGYIIWAALYYQQTTYALIILQGSLLIL